MANKATTATVSPVARPRGSLTDEQIQRLTEVLTKRDEVQAEVRAEVLAVMAEGGSFSEVSKATGLSTHTLQRWKREASS